MGDYKNITLIKLKPDTKYRDKNNFELFNIILTSLCII